MKTPVLHFMFLALLGSFFTPLAVAYASPSLADSVHFCQLIDFEQSERDRGPAAKRLQNLNVGEPRTVRLIYFLPNDRPYRADVVQKMKTQILEIQTFYAEQMAVHGHGNKTFQIETDAQGEPLVHRVDGQLPASSYEGASTSEIQQVFDVDANIYFIVFDIGSETLGRALGLATQSTKNGGYALVTDEFSFITAAHELGHTFGLYHDFRDNRYIMSYGLERHPLSACAAEFLAVHTYFNPDSPIEKTSPPTIELISPTEYPAGSESVSVQLRATDSDGLHQVIPFVLTKNIFFGAGFPEVKACYGLGSKTETVVVYDYDGDIPSDDYTSLASTPSHNLRAMVVDTDGNQTWTSFRLTEASSYHIATLEGHTNDVRSVAFSPDGTILASGSDDGTARLWDVATRARIGTLEDGGRVQSVAFSPDGTTLASGSENATVKLWDVATSTSIGTLQDRGGVQSVAFSPNGTTLASGSRGSTVRLWDVATRTNINTLTYSMNPTVWDVAFSPDGTTLASGASDSAIKLWDVATGADIATLEHTSWVTSVAFSPNGTMLASAAGTLVRLWDVATRTNINTLEGHTYGVYSVAFSPDGATLASGSGDGTIRLWDVLTGKELAVFPSSSPSVAFSPDGTMLASGSYDNTVELWDTSEWTQPRLHRLVKISGDNQQGTPDAALANPLIVEARDQYGNPLPDAQVTFTVTAGEGQLSGWFTIEHATTDADGRVELTFTLGPYAGTNTVGVSIAGRELVTFNAMGIGTPTVSIMDGDYRTWSLPNGAIARLGKGSLGETDRAVALSPDRQHLAVASSIGVWLYDVTTGRELALLPMANVRSVAFSPDGMKLASYGTEGITLWDVATGANIATFRGGSPVFSPDGTILASLWGNTVRLWDVATGANIANLEGHTQSLASVSFSPDGTILASGSRDNTVRLWDMATRTSIATLEGHGYYVRSVAFSPDGAILASGSDREVKLWDVATRANVATLEGGFFVAFSPDGTTLASGGVNSLIKLWDVVTGTQINTFEGHTGRVFSVAFSPNGTTLVSGGADDTVRLWDMAMGSVAILSGHTGRVFSVAFSPDGTTLASGGMNSLVKLWDVATGRVAILSGHTGEVFSVAFSPDGTTLASGALNDFGRLWDVAMGTQINTLGRSGWSVAFSPDGTILASGHTDRTIKLWDVATGTQINTFEGHTDWVRSVAFSPDGTILASGSFDNTLKLWDMATGTNSATLSGHTNDVESVAFSPDGTTLASGARDQKVLLWDVATRASIGTLEDRENVLSVAFSPDGAILASGAGTEVTLWDAATNTNSATLSGHASTVNSVAFSSDAATLASSSDDGTILLWDTSAWTTPPVVNHPPTGVVTISGTAAVGEILTADASTVMDPDGPSTLEFSYQWLADASPIAGATSQTYTLTANEIGKKIRVRVSYIDGLGALVNITSEETELFAGICDRTEEVQTVILNLIAGVSDCALVTGAHLAAITELDLEGQSIPALQVGDFDGLTALTSLNLDNNQLTALPVGIFDNLTNLIHLYLTDNQLTALPVGTFDNLGVLETLYLTNNQLTALPEGIDNLTTLTRLALNSNQLTALPEGIFDTLTNLTSLDLDDNQLTALPVGIDKLTNLTSLGLDRNQLTSLPVGIFDNLTNLTGLDLAGNQLTALPEGIFDKLTNLTQLYLDNNQLTALPEGIFGNLNALTTLHLDGNQLTALPEGIFDGIALLTTLTLYNGPVDPLPLMVSLEKVGADQVKAVAPSGVPFDMVLPLSVASGSISGGATTITIPVGSVESQPLTVMRTPSTTAAVTVDIGTLPGLPSNHQGYAPVKSADLPLTVIDPLAGAITPVCDRTPQVRDAIVATAPVSACGDVAEAHLASITQLYLYEEKIRTLKPGDFDGLTVLTTLRLDGNELSSLPEGVFDNNTALTQLFLHDNQLSSLPEGIFENNTALTTLYLHTNQLSSLPAGIFENNTALTSLTLRTNQLSSLPEGVFDNNTVLTQLFLHDNQLSSLPEGVFNNNTALTQLYLHTNQLSLLPEGIFDNNTVLTELHLSGNQLGSLPEGIFDNNTALTWLTLSGNQLSSLPAGIFDNNTALTQLSLGTNKLSSLPAGIFENLTALTHLYMDQNQLSSLPAGIFKNLTALTQLAVDSLPLTVSLEKVGEGQFKAVAPTGAPFDIALPLNVTNGSLSGGATTITIPAGSVESEILTVTRTLGTSGTVAVWIGQVPGLPANHRGYALVKSADLPLEVLVASEPENAEIRILASTGDIRHIRTPIHSGNQSSLTVHIIANDNGQNHFYAGAFSGLSSVETLSIRIIANNGGSQNHFYAGAFSGLSSLKTLDIDMTSNPGGGGGLNRLYNSTFSGLSSLETLMLEADLGYWTPGGGLFPLPQGVFSGLSSLKTLELTKIYAGLTGYIFSDLSSLKTLKLSGHGFNIHVQTFSGLSSLTTLDMSNYPLRIYGGTFRPLSSLETLKLNYLGNTMYGFTSSWPSLTTLELDANSVTTLPAPGMVGVFSGLSSLKTLRLSINSVTSLPAPLRTNVGPVGVFHGLSSLETLKLSIGSVTTIPGAYAANFPGLLGPRPGWADIFVGMSSLARLEIVGSSLTSLPPYFLLGRSSLTALKLASGSLTSLPENFFSYNPLPNTPISTRPRLPELSLMLSSAPLPITVSLSMVEVGQFKARVPTGAPFDINVPIHSSNGTIADGISSVMIPAGSVESDFFTVSRTPGTSAAATVDIGTLPTLPNGHTGYFLVKSTNLPLEVSPDLSIVIPVCDRTPQVRDAIVAAVSVVSDCNDVTDAHLTAITSLNLTGNPFDLETDDIKALKPGDFSGLSALTTLRLNNNDLTTLPTDIFSGLSSLTFLYLNGNDFSSLPESVFDQLISLRTLWLHFNRLTTLPEGIFDELTQLTELVLSNNPLTTLPAGIFDEQTKLTELILVSCAISSLPDGIFDGLPELRRLDLGFNQLSSLPDGIFDGLTQLIELDLLGNRVRPLLITVSLEKVGADQFKAVAPTGAPFDIVLPLSVTNGSISGGTTTLTISKGSRESNTLTVTRTAGTTTAVTADFGTLPRPPLGHGGYALVKSVDLPLEVISSLAGGICARTAQVQTAIVAVVSDVSTCGEVTEAHLATGITSLFLNGQSITALQASDFAGLTGLAELRLYDNQLTTLPADLFDGLTALTTLYLNGNQLSTLPEGLFDGLSSLTTLYLYGNSVDPLSLTVSLEKVGADQVKAVAPAGAPFDLVLPLSVTNGSISGGATTLTIPAGSLESQPLTVTRTPSTTAAVTMDIGTLPRPPTNHSGYTLVKSNDLPLEIISATTPNTATVNIPDANLRANIETALGKASGDPISAAEMATLTSLSAQDASISDLTGLETTTNLTELQLWDNNIADIAAVAGLTKLTKLYLWGNTITDLSHVAALTNLTDLRLGENSIANVSAVAALTQLTHLHLNENSVSDISAVAGLTNLIELRIGDNTISSIAAVANLTKLVWLDAPNNSISDMAAVANLTSLTSLTMSGNSITDLSAVVGLTNLLELYLAENAISDLSPLVANTGLGANTEIDVQGNLLDYPSIYTHIPALQARSVFVEFDNRTPTTLVKISGDSQQGTPETALAQPFVVEVQDANNVAFTGVPVAFAITAGGGTLSATNTTTDANGQAESTLTLGNSAGTNTVQVSVQGIAQTETFTAEATTTDSAVGEGTEVTTYNVDDAIPLPTGFQTPRLTIGSGRAVTADNGTYTCVAAVDCIIANGAVSQGTIEVTTSAVASNTDETPVVSALTPVCDRTPQVRDEIVAAVPSVSDCNDVTEAHLAAITGTLSLIGESITALAAGDFAGLTALENLNLRVNPLTTLPAGVFDGLTALTGLDLSDNPGAPFAPKAVALPDDGTIPVAGAGGTVTLDGSGSGGPWGTNVTYGWALTSPASGVTVTFDDDTSATPVVTIPALTEGTELTFTLTVTAVPSGATGTAPDTDTATVTATASIAGICGRTPQVQTTILRALQSQTPSPSTCGEVTKAHLTSDITSLFLNGQGITTLQAGDFEDLTSLAELRLYDNQLTTLPADLFDGLTALTMLYLNGNQLSSLPDGLFDGLASLATLYLYGNSVDPLLLTVSLEKVGTDQVKAVAPAGAPFEIVLPLTVANGDISSGATSITIPAGSLESQPLTVTRTPSTTAAVTMDIGTLPGLPAPTIPAMPSSNPADLPLEVISATTPNTAAVNIPDANLRANIETALGKTSGDPISPAEIATLTSLSAQDASISDLTGLETATNLTELQLWDNEISDIAAVAGLTKLTKLYLWGNAITDISHVAALTNLTDLRLGENSIANISAVANLTNLTHLGLRENAVSDIAAVAGLTKLTELRIGDNTISSIAAVANLTNLEWLDAPNNRISDIAAVTNLTNLTSLTMSGNSISDLSAVAGLTKLLDLYLAENAVSDLSPLVANTGLGADNEIDVQGNPLDYPSIYTHIPALQARSVFIDFDNRTPTTLVQKYRAIASRARPVPH